MLLSAHVEVHHIGEGQSAKSTRAIFFVLSGNEKFGGVLPVAVEELHEAHLPGIGRVGAFAENLMTVEESLNHQNEQLAKPTKRDI